MKYPKKICQMSNVTGITGNLCNKCPKQLVKQISSFSDYFNVISGFTSNSRAPEGPVTLQILIRAEIFNISDFNMHYGFQYVLKFSTSQISTCAEMFNMLFQDVFNTFQT